MAVSKEQLKEWFSKGKTPTESQFHEWIDSYLHNDDKLEVDSGRPQDLIVVKGAERTIDCNDNNNKFIYVDTSDLSILYDTEEKALGWFESNLLYYADLFNDPAKANFVLSVTASSYDVGDGISNIDDCIGYIYDGAIEIAEDFKESIAESLHSISSLEQEGSDSTTETQDLLWLYLKDIDKIKNSELTHIALQSAVDGFTYDWVQRGQMSKEYIPIYLKGLRDNGTLSEKDNIFVPITEKVLPVCSEVFFDDDFDKIEAYSESLFFGAIYKYNNDSQEYEFIEVVAQKFSDGVFGLEDNTTVWCIVYSSAAGYTDVLLDVSKKDFSDGSEVILKTQVYDDKFVYLKITDNAELKILTEREGTESSWLMSSESDNDTYVIVKNNDVVYQPNAFKITFSPPIDENSEKNIVWLHHIYDENSNYYADAKYAYDSYSGITYQFDYSIFNII